MKKKLLMSIITLVVVTILVIVASFVVCQKMSKNVNVNNGKIVTKNNNQQVFNFSKAFNKGEFDKIINETEKQLKQKGDDKNLLGILASAYLQKGSLEFKEDEFGRKGLEVADKILKQDQKNTKAYYLKGYAYEIMQKYDKALENYNKANEIKETALVDNQIGHTYDLQGDNKKAEEYYKKALVLDASFSGAKINMARIAFANGKDQEAVDTFADVYQMTKNKREKSDAAYMMGLVYLKKGSKKHDLKKAEKSMQMAVDADRKSPNAWLGLGKMAYQKAFEDKTSDFKKFMQVADKSFNMAITLNPEQTLAYVYKGRLLLVNNFKEDAGKVFNIALKVVDKDITLMADDRIKLKKEIQAEMKRSGLKIVKISLINKIYNNVKNIHFVPVALAELNWDEIEDNAGDWYSSIDEAGTEHQTRRLDNTVIDGYHVWTEYHYKSRAEVEKLIATLEALDSGDHFIWKDGYLICNNGTVITWELPANPDCGPADGVDVGLNGPDTSKLCASGSTASTVSKTGSGTASDPYNWQWTCSKKDKIIGCSAGQDSSTYLTELKCGPANKYGPSGKGFERTSAVISAGRCQDDATVTNFKDNSSLADSGAVAWTWNCERNDKSVDCEAIKKGECADIENAMKPPYNPYVKACRFGAFHSVVLDEGVFKWKCGTGEEEKTVGSFYEGDTRYINTKVGVDYYGPHDGGVDCKCAPKYKYTCVKIADADCSGRCGNGQFGDETWKAYKHDINCFPNDTEQIVDEDEYNSAPLENKPSGQPRCSNKKVQCPPCGVNNNQNGEGGTFFETN